VECDIQWPEEMLRKIISPLIFAAGGNYEIFKAERRRYQKNVSVDDYISMYLEPFLTIWF